MSAVMERQSATTVADMTSVLSLVDKLMTIHHGTSNGYYEILADFGSVTYVELATIAGATESAAKEWLETQVALGVVIADLRQRPEWDRRYHLPASRAAFLLDLEDPFGEAYAVAA
jgi:hypothetical protein